MSDKSIYGNRALRVTPRGQRAIGQPVTVQVTVELDAIRAVLDAAGDQAERLKDLRPGQQGYVASFRYLHLVVPRIRHVRERVEQAAADADADVRPIR